MNLPGTFPVSGFFVALEITPPRELRPGILLRRARLLGDLVSRVHVIQRPGRMSSLEASLLLADAGFEPVLHLVNRGRTRQDIDAELRQARAGGIERVLCIRGEGDDKDQATTPRIHEVVARLRGSWPSASVGVTVNQYGHQAPPRVAEFHSPCSLVCTIDLMLMHLEPVALGAQGGDRGAKLGVQSVRSVARTVWTDSNYLN